LRISGGSLYVIPLEYFYHITIQMMRET
jgi:hypothetical protein